LIAARYPSRRLCGLFEQVEAPLKREGLALIRPDNKVLVAPFFYHVNCIALTLCPRRNNAVSNGAISFFLDHFVHTRVAKVSYGTKLKIPYDGLDPEHIKRSALKVIDVDGKPKLLGRFEVVLPKVGLIFHYLL